MFSILNKAGEPMSLTQAKHNLINTYKKKYGILGKKCPYTLVVDQYKDKQPRITLVNVDVEQLINNNTIEIKIPNIVEAIDTSRFYYLGAVRQQEINKIVLIGNGKALHGRLRGLFSLESNSYNKPWSNKKYQSTYYKPIEFLEEVEIHNFDGQNIRDISYLLYERCVTKINLADLNLKRIEQADWLFDNSLDMIKELIKTGVSFQDCTSIQGISQLGTGENLSLDAQELGVSKLTSLKCMFLGAYGISNVQFKNIKLNRTLDLESLGRDQEIEEITGLDGVCAQNLQEAFTNCEYLKRVPQIDIRKAKSLKSALYGCAKLEWVSIDSGILSGGLGEPSTQAIQTQATQTQATQTQATKAQERAKLACKDMSRFVENCRQLRSLEIKNVEFTQLEDICGLARSCIYLQEILIENVKINVSDANRLNLSNLIQQCLQLRTIRLKNIEIASELDSRTLLDLLNNLEEQNLTVIELDNIKVKGLPVVKKNISNILATCMLASKKHKVLSIVKANNIETYV